MYFFIGLIYIFYKCIYIKLVKFKIFSVRRYFRYLKLIIKKETLICLIISSIISNFIVLKQNYKYQNLYNGINNVKAIAIVKSEAINKIYYNIYKVKILNLNGDTKFKNSYIYIRTNQNLEYENCIKFEGEFIEPDIQRNYKGFDYKEYLKTKKVYGTIKTSKIDIIKKEKFGVDVLLNKLRDKIKSNIKNTYKKDVKDLILGIMLGDTQDLDEQLKQDFSESNISHILAVSGLHISYIILLVSYLFNKLFGKRASKILTSIILILYMFITNFSISVTRAGICAILGLMSFVFYRQSDTWNNISISLLIILIYNPFNLENSALLLSYGATIGILVFKDFVENILNNKKQNIGRIKESGNKVKDKLIKVYLKILIGIKQIVIVSLAVQIMIAPVIIITYKEIGISFLISNVLISFIIGFIVIFGFIQIFVSFINIKFGIIISKILYLPLKLLIIISKMGTIIPFGNIYVISPSNWQVILYYILIFLIYFLYKNLKSKELNFTQKRIKNLLLLLKYKIKSKNKIILLLMFCIFISNIILRFYIPSYLKLYFVDIGQGDCTLIITPQGKNILIDGGGSENYDIGKNILLPYLLSRKINKIDYAFISHFDTDHCGGLLTILEEIKVGHVIIGKQFEKNDNIEKFEEIINKKKIQVNIAEKGSKINIEKGLYFDILWPISSNKINENCINNNALVCKLNYKNCSILFTGDIEEKTEKELIKTYGEELNSDILKVGHHGSKSSSTEEFIEAVHPKIALIGVGQNNKYGHPNDEVINRLEKIKCNTYRTDENGEISIMINKSEQVRVNKHIN